MYFYCKHLCILIVVYVFLDAATLTEVFPCFFLGCKANARVTLAKTGHGPHSSKIVVLLYVLFVLYCSVYCLCVNVYCHRVTTQLQLTNISYHFNWTLLHATTGRVVARAVVTAALPLLTLWRRNFLLNFAHLYIKCE